MCYDDYMMNPVGVRELKANLSAYVDRARNGEEIIVMLRGEPVVRITPLDYEDPRARGLREGWLKPAQRPGSLRDHVFPKVTIDREAQRELQRDRDRWDQRVDPDQGGDR